MSRNKVIYKTGHSVKRFIFTFALVTLCLGLASGQVSSQRLNTAAAAKINLIPLPKAPSPELPLTGFQAHLESVPADPRAEEVAARLHEAVNRHKAQVGAGIQRTQPERAPGGARLQQQGSTSTAPATPRSRNRKTLPADLAHLGALGSAVPSAQLEAVSPDLTGNPLEVRMRPIGTPRQIKIKGGWQPGLETGAQLESAGRGDRDELRARAFLKQYRSHLRIDDPDSEMSLDRKESDKLNRTHLRFNQYYQGLPVWPAKLIVHLDPNGKVDVVDGAFVPTPRKLTTSPAVSSENAVSAARIGVPGGGKASASQPELIVYGALEQPARLAWKLKLDASPASQWIVVVDALDGKILTAFNTVVNENVQGSGIDLLGNSDPLDVWHHTDGYYYLVDTSKPMFLSSSSPPDPSKTKGAIIITDARDKPPTNNPQTLPNLYYVTSADSNSGWLADGVSAAFNLSNVYDYYYNVLGRNSIDGNGGNISAVVRLGLKYQNAFWNPNANCMFFGDGLPFAAATDVVGHELTHGVTSHTAQLVQLGQSGALNEGFSDIFGEMVENYVTKSNDWVMGETLGVALRNLKDPALGQGNECGGPYPSDMGHYYKFSLDANGDYGGVHCNSTIFSHAYYLLAVGLSDSIGIADAEQIFHRAQTVHLTSHAQFIDARLACIQSAEELFKQDPTIAAKVGEAFDAVQIFDNAPTPHPNPAPAGTGKDATLFVAYDETDPSNPVYSIGRKDPSRNDPASGVWLSSLDHPSQSDCRPSVTADGSLALYVTADYDLCLIYTDGSSETCLGMQGTVFSAAMSPDGNHFGFVLVADLSNGTPDNKVSYAVLSNNQTPQVTQTYDLVAPATEGITVDSIDHADAMAFTSNNRFLIYDALNNLTLSDGSQISDWSIYAIDLVTGQTLLVVPPMAGLDIAYPQVGHTSDDFITFEAMDQSVGKSTVYAGNLNTGDSARVVTNLSDYGIPTFTGNDLGIVYSVTDTSTTGYSLNEQPLKADHMSPNSRAPKLWLYDADQAAIYRRGVHHALSVTNENPASGIVTSDKGGIVCGDSCSNIYLAGTTVTLAAKSYDGWTFAGWGGSCSGTGTCKVLLAGDLAVTASFQQASAPGVPTGVTAKEGNPGQATVTFNKPADGGAPITGYTVTSSPGSIQGHGIGTSVLVTGLTNNVSYTFTVIATNMMGPGPVSGPSNAVVPYTTPDPPTNVSAQPGNTRATVSFTAPLNNGGRPITNYMVTSTEGKSVATGTKSPIVVTKLQNGTPYAFTVTAVNKRGAGPASGASSSVTPASVPGAPTSVTAKPGDTKATVSFTAPASNGGSQILGYTVTSNPAGGKDDDAESTSTSHNVTGLTNGKAYTFTVKARNVMGEGSASNPSTSVTPATLPGAPTIGTATAGVNKATVTFAAPSSNGGRQITGYTVTSNDGKTASGATSPISVPGLTGGTPYTFTVMAKNAIGAGAASGSSNSAIPMSVPGAPTGVTATAGNALATVNFSAPLWDGGKTITGYTVTSIPAGGRDADAGKTSLSHKVTGLKNGTPYTFTVKATNSIGTGTASTASNPSVTPSTVPGAPTGVTAKPGDTQATVSFTAPASNGGSSIIGYTVTSIPAGCTDVDAGKSSTSHSVTGLANGTAYKFTVTAANINGDGAASAYYSAIPN